MEKMSPEPQRSPSIVPLARDQDGNPIELPDGAIGWRTRRQTGGRPRLLLDSKKQPMLFPLDYTVADVEDILPPGNYLLDVVDKNGEPLGVTVGLSIGMTRNAESVEPDNEDNAATVVPTTLPNTTSDVRLVLEANVRATQMAFIHNQRTLEIGLRMAETLRDSVQVLAGSQADWIKSIASARGFFRNAGPALAPVEVKQLTVTTGGGDDGDEDDDGMADAGHDGGDTDDGDAGDGGDAGDESDSGDSSNGSLSTKHWSEAWLPVVNHLMVQVLPMVNMWTEKLRAEARDRRAGGGASGVADAAGAPASADEQAAAQAEHARAEQLGAAVVAASSPGRGMDLMKLLQLLPPETSAKLMRIQTGLSLDEQTDAMQILRGYPVDELRDLLITFDLASLEECVAFLRRLIGEWRKNQAARNARATEASPVHSDDGHVVGRAADPRAEYAASVDALRVARAEQERAAQEHAVQLASAIADASSPGPGINIFKLLALLPPYTATKLTQINAALSPEEQGDAMQVLKSYSVDGMHALLTAIDATAIDECIAFLRSVVADWRAHQAAAEAARASETRAGIVDRGGTSAAVGSVSTAGSSGTSRAAGPRSAGGPRSSSDAADSGASGAGGASGAAGSGGTSSSVDSSPSSTADPSTARSSSGAAGSGGAAGSSGAASVSDGADSNGKRGSSDAVTSSSAVALSGAIAPSDATGPGPRAGSGSKKPPR